MRFVLLAVALTGCLSGNLDANLRPGVMPKLSELPGDAEKRDGILNQSGERAGPEQRKTLTRGERKVETMAAVVAALIGEAFSTTKNVTIGVASSFDENQLFEDPPPKAPKPVAPVLFTPSTELVPWIRIDQKSKPADIDSVR